MTRDRPTAFVGDSHLLPDDGSTEAFLGFLESAPGRFARLVLVGDIFDLWIARRRLHDQHHDSVLAALQRARERGLAIDYAVGNRDYLVESLPGSPFDRVGTVELLDTSDSPAWVAEHGDLINEDDTSYRRWRRFSRSRIVLGLFLALPSPVARRLSLWLERRLRTTNLAYKRRFPEEHALRRAAGHVRHHGIRFVVLGHFHQELRLRAQDAEILVLPDWKRSRRHLEWDPDSGTMTFVASGGSRGGGP